MPLVSNALVVHGAARQVRPQMRLVGCVLPATTVQLAQRRAPRMPVLLARGATQSACRIARSARRVFQARGAAQLVRPQMRLVSNAPLECGVILLARHRFQPVLHAPKVRFAVPLVLLLLHHVSCVVKAPRVLLARRHVRLAMRVHIALVAWLYRAPLECGAALLARPRRRLVSSAPVVRLAERMALTQFPYVSSVV